MASHRDTIIDVKESLKHYHSLDKSERQHCTFSDYLAIHLHNQKLDDMEALGKPFYELFKGIGIAVRT